MDDPARINSLAKRQAGGVRELVLARSSASSDSKLAKWRQFKTQFGLDALKEINHTDLLDYGSRPYFQNNISSATSYISAAHTEVLSSRSQRFTSSQKEVDRVYAAMVDVIEKIPLKSDPTVSILPQPYIKENLRILAFMAGTGLRPTAAAHLDGTCSPVWDDYGSWAIAAVFMVSHDKVQKVSSRPIHFACACKSADHLCCIHTLGLPEFPISQAKLGAAIKASGVDTSRIYGTRRRHVLGVARIISYSASSATNTRYKNKVKDRINAQMGWTKASSQFLNYCSDEEKWVGKGQELWGVCGGMARLYLTGKLPSPYED